MERLHDTLSKTLTRFSTAELPFVFDHHRMKLKMTKKSKAKNTTRKPPSRRGEATVPTENKFADLTDSYVSESDDDIPSKPRVSQPTLSLKPAGTDNQDGTVFGGGPRDIMCSKCVAAGFPTDVAHGHRSNQIKYCPILQANSKKHEAAAVDPKLRDIAAEHLPERPNLSKSPHQTMDRALLQLEGLSPKLILLSVTESTCTAMQGKMALLSLMEEASASERELLQIYIQNISELVPAAEKQGLAKLQMPGVLQAQGKLVGLWHSVVKHSRKQMHKQGKTEQTQTPTYNLMTGEVTVNMPTNKRLKQQRCFTWPWSTSDTLCVLKIF